MPCFRRRGPDADGEDSAPSHAGADLPRIPGYEVEALLGRGGMGIVYKARHLRLNRFVALKMLITGAYAGPNEQARFQREAEAVASLRHANIVQVYDVGDHEGWPYFTMELLEGGSLAQALAGTPQPARQAAALLGMLAEAVQAAHRAGIVHRDLKPANILLTAEGTPKVADFGLARHFDDEPALTLSGVRIGTPSYMAPEQVIGKPGTIGPAADIYSLGAIFYEMLTGRPPFRGETATETQRQVIAEEPVPPARLNPKVPRDLETICLACLHKDPGRRYATAEALADDLKRFLHDEPIAARPAGLPERTVKWVRRHPTSAAMLAASLLLVMLVVGGSLWLAIQQAHRRAAIEADLKEMARLRETARWTEARAALDRAEARLDGGGPRRPEPAARRGPARPRPGDPARHDPAESGDTWRARILQGPGEPGLRGGLRAGRIGNEPRSTRARRGADRRIGHTRGARGRRVRLGGLRRRQGAAGLAAGGRAANRLELRRLARACPRSGRMGGSTDVGGIGPDRARGERVPLAAAGARGTAQGRGRGHGPVLAAGAGGAPRRLLGQLDRRKRHASVGPPGSGRVLPRGAGKPTRTGGGLLRGRRRPETSAPAGSGHQLLREGPRARSPLCEGLQQHRRCPAGPGPLR